MTEEESARYSEGIIEQGASGLLKTFVGGKKQQERSCQRSGDKAKTLEGDAEHTEVISNFS